MLSTTFKPSLLGTQARLFTCSALAQANSTSATSSLAVCYAENGDPTKVLSAHRYTLPQLNKGQVRVKFELGAVNPADINVIQGVYPSKPAPQDLGASTPLHIMGNEGVGIVEGFQEDGTVENQLKIGDTVTMGAAQLGTWQTRSNVNFTSLIPLRTSPSLTPTQAATLSINPPTAWRMLTDFINLNPHEGGGAKGEKKPWVIQNGANSAVGTAVIQLCKQWGVGTINLVRDRDDIDTLKSQLHSLGADKVLTYSEFLKRETRGEIKELTEGNLRLGLNCVGGKETTEMAKLLGLDGFLVTYGGMAKVPLALPPSLFIFRKLTSTGFWLSNWVQTHPAERLEMMNSIGQMIADGKFKEPETEVVTLKGGPEKVGEIARETMRRLEEGKLGKKVLFKVEDDE